MASLGPACRNKRFTASGSLTYAGAKGIRVFGVLMQWKSNATGAVNFRSGTAAGGKVFEIRRKVTVPISTPRHIDMVHFGENGFVVKGYKSACYVELSGASTQANIFWGSA